MNSGGVDSTMFHQHVPELNTSMAWSFVTFKLPVCESRLSSTESNPIAIENSERAVHHDQ